MQKHEFARALGELMASLAVPVSLGMPGIEKAREPWGKLHMELAGFGWKSAEEYESAVLKMVS